MPSPRRPCISSPCATPCAAQIAGVTVDRRATRRLSRGVLAAFLMCEAAAAQDGAVARQLVAPMPLDAQPRRQHQIWPAEPEVDEMGQAERQYVARSVRTSHAASAIGTA